VLNVHLLVDASRSMDWGDPSKLRYADGWRRARLCRAQCVQPTVRLAIERFGERVRPGLGPRSDRRHAQLHDDFRPAQLATPISAPPAGRPTGSGAELIHQSCGRIGGPVVRSAVASWEKL